MTRALIVVGVLVFLVNVPFGCWRGRSQRFSRSWMFAVHLPVPLVILIRYLSGIGFRLVSFPIVIGCFFLGQLVGSAICRKIRARKLNHEGHR